MRGTLRILHLEDDPDYAEWVRAMLTSSGLDAEVVRAGSGAEFAAMLDQPFDLILSDYHLPDCTGLAALHLARDKAPDTPFILVSGTAGEQVAIECLKCGATDYVLKQWPERLVPAIQRAVREAAEHRSRVVAERELAQRERYFRALTENSLDVLTILDIQGIITYCSASAVRVLGYPAEVLLGRSVFEQIHPEDRPRVREAFEHGLHHPAEAVRVEFRFQHGNGAWRRLESVGQNLLNDPAIGGVVVHSRDVTERKRAETRAALLARLGRNLNSATSREAAAHIIKDAADELIGWDAFAFSLYYEATDRVDPVLVVDTVQGRRVALDRPWDSDEPSPIVRRVIANGAQLILRDNADTMLPEADAFGDKSRPSASLLFVPMWDGNRVIGVLSIQSYTFQAYTREDLDTLQILADHCGGAVERIWAEQTLRETQHRLSGLFENSPDAIFVEDLEGRVLDVNPAACRLHGLSREELLGRHVCDLCPPELRETVLDNITRLTEGGLQQFEGVSLAADGRHVPVEIRTRRIEYAGRPALLLHVRDLTERKRAESALRDSELLFSSVWENSVDGMRLTDEDGVIVAVNEAFCKLVDRPRDQLEGQPFTVIYAESESHNDLLANYRQRFRNRVIERQVLRRITLHNGSAVELEDTSSFVEMPGRAPLLLGLFRDVTLQKRLEEQLRQSQKMDAIGQLAGGVAHDFNNILTIIQGHASLLLAANNLAGPAWRSAQQIGQAAERAAGLTRQLLTFSRRQVMQPRRLDLNEVVSNLTKMLGRILGEDIALRLHYCPQPLIVMADASMVEQVLLNLVVNSRDAMPKGGQLSLRLGIVEVNADHLELHPEAHPGTFVCLEATDTGCGIKPENLRRIFEPFFTTKEVGKGTGLGLATVYGVVKQHQGWIEVESQVGRGTTFRVYFPRHQEAGAAAEARGNEPSIRGGNETILVVEDEYNLRELVCAILEGYGYTVLQAASGPKAIEVWSQQRNAVDLLLTDLVMPDRMNGRELAERLWQDEPKLPVVFTSGYSADVVGKDFVLRHGLNYLQKPYHPQKLALTIREVLDKVVSVN
ncbi:MAG TPA: PAS domain S-box protein [Verrucomicrobiae bacterium]